MDYKDYYKTMGLNRDATDKAIKSAYQKLARKYHPDLNKESGAEEKFKEIGEAYEVLRDPEKRKIYDQYEREENLRKKTQQNSSQKNWNTGQKNYQFSDDFFESLFGSRPFHAQAAGSDYRSTIKINLEEAYKGTIKDLHLPAISHLGIEPQKLRVKVPAGVKAGQQIRLAGQGAPGQAGGPRGDLYLTIDVEKHSLFDVMGNDVYLTFPVTPWEVALGATLAVPTLGGKVDLKIPPNAQGGQTLRLKKRGLPGNIPGDQYVILKIVIPQPHNEEEKELYKKMAAAMPFNPREKMGI